MDILDFSKTLAESALQLMYASKEGGGNPKVTQGAAARGLIVKLEKFKTEVSSSPSFGRCTTTNPKYLLQSLNTHDAIMDASSATKEAIDDLLKSVQEAPEALVSGMVDSISNSVKVCCLCGDFLRKQPSPTD